MDEGDEWVTDGVLNRNFYYKDLIHLNHEGNLKFADTIIRKLKEIVTSSTSSSADTILRIPTRRTPQNVVRRFTRHVPPPPSTATISQPLPSPPAIAAAIPLAPSPLLRL